MSNTKATTTNVHLVNLAKEISRKITLRPCYLGFLQKHAFPKLQFINTPTASIKSQYEKWSNLGGSCIFQWNCPLHNALPYTRPPWPLPSQVSTRKVEAFCQSGLLPLLQFETSMTPCTSHIFLLFIFFEAKNMTLFGKPADREDGRLISQNRHLPLSLLFCASYWEALSLALVLLPWINVLTFHSTPGLNLYYFTICIWTQMKCL